MTVVARRFDQAAGTYDKAARIQSQVAGRLIEKAAEKTLIPPRTILDIGCGTGLVAERAARWWPDAHMTLMDAAPTMLERAKIKVPNARIILRDISAPFLEPAFDLIFSSMALHWMPDPHATLNHWRKGLTPHGRLFTAILAEGSFREWRDLCVSEGLQDGFWPLPCSGFAEDIAVEIEQQLMIAQYPSVLDFLHRLKGTGAATPRSGHRPFSPASMRRLLLRAPQPFCVTYRTLYMNAPWSSSI